jgi:tetratricopeptide (TPR) repeat protein
MRNSKLIKGHNRFVAVSFLIYLITLGGLVYFFNYSSVKHHITYSLIENVLNERILKEPENAALYQDLAILYHNMGKYGEAKKTYERIIDLDPNRPVSLNNLAWLLVTVPQEALRDEMRGLDLAKRAVALERSPVFLDTLAEAYYANGFIQKAIDTIDEAIRLATENKSYYRKQLEKFLSSRN